MSAAGGRLRGAARRVLAVALKELRQLARDRLTLGFIVGIPSLQLVLFGYAINLDVRRVPTAVLDRADSSLSRHLVGELAATQTFTLTRVVRSEREAFRLLEDSTVGAVIVVPPDLDRRLLRGRGAELSLLADGSNPTVASAVMLTGQGYGADLAHRLRPFHVVDPMPALRLTDREGARFAQAPELVRAESVRVAVLPLYNPERRTAVFIVPGLVGVILTMTMMLMTALAVVRERERGTFEFLIATPVRSWEVMVGKIVPYLLVGLVQVALVLALGRSLFDVPIRGSLLELGLASLPFLAAMLTMGLVVSSLARTQFQATQMSFFFFLPSILLSGFMFPFEAMPRPAQWIGALLPLTHFLRIVRGILLKGASLGVLMGEIGAIAAFMAAALAVAVATFRKRLA
ncbi:MAG TPA: ABC transporter permease [Candidatus Limnocylindria bacterium]|nr:ABC transporter permease [Candidatus Limnocylindria bacterium]